jgi:hypothetical protein
MNRLGRLMLLFVMVGALSMAFVAPAFAKTPSTPCGQYPPNPNCPDTSPSNNGGNPGNGDGHGNGGPPPKSAIFPAGGITYGEVVLVLGGLGLGYAVIQRRRTRRLVSQS